MSESESRHQRVPRIVDRAPARDFPSGSFASFAAPPAPPHRIAGKPRTRGFRSPPLSR